jgi:cysteine desulfurase/selenocysteine lyase
MIEEVTLERAKFRPPPRRFEAGSPPIAAAIGLGAALDWMQSLDWSAIQNHELRLTRRLLDGLASIAGVRVLGPKGHPRAAGRRVVLRRHGERLGDLSASRRARCRFGGHHCAQLAIRAFGVEGAARASFAPYTLENDIDALLEGLDELVSSKRRGREN